MALSDQAGDPEVRESWAERGLQRIEELDLSPEAHAKRIEDILSE